MKYTEIPIEECVTIQVGLTQKLSLRAIGQMLERNPSSIFREVKHNANLFS